MTYVIARDTTFSTHDDDRLYLRPGENVLLARRQKELHLRDDPRFQFVAVHYYHQWHVISRLCHVECIRVASSRFGTSKLDSKSDIPSISDFG